MNEFLLQQNHIDYLVGPKTIEWTIYWYTMCNEHGVRFFTVPLYRCICEERHNFFFSWQRLSLCCCNQISEQNVVNVRWRALTNQYYKSNSSSEHKVSFGICSYFLFKNTWQWLNNICLLNDIRRGIIEHFSNCNARSKLNV